MSVSFPEYPNAERFFRFFGRMAFAGLGICVVGLVLGSLSSGVAQAMWFGTTLPIGLFFLVTFWLIRRRGFRMMERKRAERQQRLSTQHDDEGVG